MVDSPELKTLTTDYPQLRTFLISEQANYREKSQRNALEHIVSNASLNVELLNSFEIFFLAIVSEFDQK